MILSEYAGENPNLPFSFTVLATDISEEVLTMGKNALNHSSRIEPISISLRKKYLMKSKDHNNLIIKITPEIRKLVTFQKLNLMDEDFGLKQTIHVAFCRNVIIYFNKITQEAILNKIIAHLVPQWYLFQGHSESTQGLNLPIKPVHPTIYQKVR